jgi:hypothetical protein
VAGRLIDLDALTEGEIEVQLGGEVYKLPPDIPIPTMLTFFELEAALKDADTDEDVAGLLRELYEEMLETFRMEQPDLERLPISLKQVPVLLREIQAIYNTGIGEKAQADADRPTRTRSRKSSPPSRRRKKASSEKT